MPGYCLASVDKDIISHRFLCNFCGFLLREAMQTSCGHHYCQSCLRNLIRDEKSGAMECLVDKMNFLPNETFPDNFMRREVRALEVHCSFVEEGCSWKGELRFLENHKQTDCKYLEVLCVHTTCSMQVKKSELADHFSKECRVRLQQCQFCDESVAYCEMKEHLRSNHNYLHRQMDNLGIEVDGLLQLVYLLQDGHRHLQNEQRRLHEAVQQLQANLCVLEQGIQQQREDDVKNALCVVKDILEDMARSRDEQGAEANPPRNCKRMIKAVEEALEVRNANPAESDLCARQQGLSSDDGKLLARKTRRVHATCQEPNAQERTAFGNPSGASPFSETPSESSGSAQNLALVQRVVSLKKRDADMKMESDTTQESFRRHDQRIESIEHTQALRKVTLADLEGYRTADHEVLLVENNRRMEEVRRDPQLLSNFEGIVQDILNQLQSGTEERRNQETKLREHSERITSLERFVASRNVSGTEASVQRLPESGRDLPSGENSSYDGQLLWKIPDYARKRNDAVTGQQVSFDSPCFYTSRHGYKMCARIYLNGDGIGKGTHISIFFGVMRSQYDALLRWPFRQKVTFMLLDQDNVEHVIDAFRPDPNSSSFQRPRKETDITSGCPMFCSLAELNNHAYVRDDTMFVKVIVDTDDL